MIIDCDFESVLIPRNQNPPDLKTQESIDARILYLRRSQPLIIPSTHRNTHRLANLLPKNSHRQDLQPCISKLPHTILFGSQRPYISHIRNHQVIILRKFLHIALDPHPSKGVGGVTEEIFERFRDCRGVEDLEHQTSATYAQLESGHWVIGVPGLVRTPLDIKADDEAVKTAVVDAFDFGDPRVDIGWCVCNYGGDGFFVKCDVVEVVGIDGEFMIHDAHHHRRGYGFCGGAWLWERMRI